MIWLFRIAKNHQALGRRLTWAPGWAIGGWFLPPIVYVIPTLMLRESWKAADPEVPAGDERWKSSSDSPLLWIWAPCTSSSRCCSSSSGCASSSG